MERDNARNMLHGLARIAFLGYITHGHDAVVWVPPRWNKAPDKQVRMPRLRGASSWHAPRGHAVRRRDLLSFCDVGAHEWWDREVGPCLRAGQ